MRTSTIFASLLLTSAIAAPTKCSGPKKLKASGKGNGRGKTQQNDYDDDDSLLSIEISKRQNIDDPSTYLTSNDNAANQNTAGFLQGYLLALEQSGILGKSEVASIIAPSTPGLPMSVLQKLHSPSIAAALGALSMMASGDGLTTNSIRSWVSSQRVFAASSPSNSTVSLSNSTSPSATSLSPSSSADSSVPTAMATSAENDGILSLLAGLGLAVDPDTPAAGQPSDIPSVSEAISSSPWRDQSQPTASSSSTEATVTATVTSSSSSSALPATTTLAASETSAIPSPSSTTISIDPSSLQAQALNSIPQSNDDAVPEDQPVSSDTDDVSEEDQPVSSDTPDASDVATEDMASEDSN